MSAIGTEQQNGHPGPADLAELADALGHRFRQPDLLVDAVTHPSVSGMERLGRRPGRVAVPGLAYERLEFLGDRVLGLVIANWLLERFPGEREGALARRLASLVRWETLSQVAAQLDLGRYLRLSTGEAESGGRTNGTILADCCEAVIGALYLDGGLPVAETFIRSRWADQIDRAASPPQDVKTALQEWAQGRGKPLPVYETMGQTGPDHSPQFEVRVHLQGFEPVVAQGNSKRAAEKAAASEMLRRVGAPINE
ncbi:ribonuclease III [Skermanella sp. TT6]|uniref:Ribonuclease 3 n=1 Tax=Skermanella cutis TaxID=2775420 RepID=A0ABX7AZL3_9PROT|nr:ribonuclease III [Skermanella sp. TT6]QQP87341.1 ribonuclease III [Skermanella sp. TT6]